MKKKIVKILGVIILLIVGVLIAAPYVLEAKIGDIIKSNVNGSIHGELDFTDAKLSLISSFPNAEVSLIGTSLTNKAPFQGDTLFAAERIDLKMGITQLFNSGDQPLAIERFSIDGANINITVDEEGNASYDIGGDSEEENESESSDSSSAFQLDLQSYEILNSSISYIDKASGMSFSLLNLQHKGTGDLSLDASELDTNTEALVSFEMDSTNYLDKNTVKLDALIGVDLKENKYSFLKNEAIINQLPLVFDGFVKLNDDNQEVDVNFKTPSSDFKNFLAVIPKEYSKNIEDVTTTGNFVLEGKFNGVVDETHIPKFNINVNSDNASFKYPDLPKAVSNVFIDIAIHNTTGIVDDTYVDIEKLSFMIDQDKFNMVSHIKDLMGNTKVDAHIDGILNLANLQKAYPVPDDLNLKGKLNADITTAFDMAAVEEERYEDTKTSGNMNLTGFEYESSEIPNPVKLNNTSLTFNPKTVTLNQLAGTTGKTDFNATGTINNLLGFMFNDEEVEGDFDLKSNTFALDDFMVAEEVVANEENTDKTETAVIEEKIKIPSFLDANIKASANTVLYDNLTLTNVKGNLRIKDEKATLSDMTSSIFGGEMAFNGEVSTKEEVPTFAMKLGMNELQISESFKSLELFKVLAPVAQMLQGNLDSDIEISGSLNDDFTPNLASLSGDMLAKILTKDIDTEKAPLVSALAGKLDFIDVDKLNLKDLKTKLSFEDGVVTVKPFTVKYQDIEMQIDGSHTFDQKLSYKTTMNVPAKYLGSEVATLIDKIDDRDSELNELTIPVTANIGGNYTSPSVTTDLSSGVKSLTSQLIEIQKKKLINQGKDKATDLLSGVLGSNSTKGDSAETTNDTKEEVSNVLSVLRGIKKDTTATETTETDSTKVEDKAKSLIKGLFKKKN